jgi:acyl-CoA hydrolase
VEVDTELPQLQVEEPDIASQAIARHVAGLIDDGACLQLGIGKIPNAILAALRDHRGLGLHTEMLGDGVVPLAKSGALDCSRKNYHAGKAVCSFALGTRALYDFVHDNAMLEFHGSEFVNDPFIIARNDNMVSVNSALEVDLTGQVNADSVGSRPYSGIGGQVDFVRGAARSRGGKSIIALPSTALKGTVSRIVPTLMQGSAVVTSRGDVHFVVTEHGVADLYARSTRERARALIAIAHPNFRPQLERRAHELKLMP